MTNYMLRFVYGARCTKKHIKYNVLNVRKIAMSGNYLVLDVFLMCRKLQYLEITWSQMCS